MSGSLFGDGLLGGYKLGYKNPKASATRSSGGGRVEKYQETIEDIQTYPCKAIPERGISEKTAQHFDIRVKLSAKDGLTHEAHYFPYYIDGKLCGYKKRDLTIPKLQKGHFSTIGYQGVQCELFGMHAANKTSKRMIVITEGEYDAAIAWQTIRENYKKDGKPVSINPTVVSITNGTSNAVQCLSQKANYKLVNKFEQVIVAFDGDKATEAEKSKGIMKGKDATAAVYSVIPQMKVSDIPEDMDPCDMYNKGMAVQLFWSFFKPKDYVPEGFSLYEQFRDKAHELPALGRPWPWPTMTKKTLGRRLGEGYFIGAGVKMGKSEWLNQLVEHIIVVEKTKVAVFKFEEENKITCQKVAGKRYHKDFTNAEKVLYPQEDGSYKDIWGNEVHPGMRGYFTQEELVEATDSVGDNIIYYNNYGRAVWDEVKGAIRHAVLVEGCLDIFIDPITRLVQGMSASDANIELERFSDEISKMAKELGFTYYCFCHLNKPENGKPHEFGGQVQSAQFAGSRAMMRNTYYMIGIERSKDPELSLKQRNTSHFVILDDRKHGRSGKFPVFYDIDTGDYLEPPEGFLESQYETLREWYLAYPDSDPTKTVMRDASVPLDPEQEVVTESDLTEADIPAMRDQDRPPEYEEEEEEEPEFETDEQPPAPVVEQPAPVQQELSVSQEKEPEVVETPITPVEEPNPEPVQAVVQEEIVKPEVVQDPSATEPPPPPDSFGEWSEEEDDECPF
ncbi:ATP-dependent helicase [Serratia phage vB_SmaM-ChuuTotoro]|nr:ATP-dependent helicase [Serratia phage vB_SmaM-ChuuTotoro]